MSSFITLLIYFSIGIYLNLQPIGQGIHNRSAYTMQTTGYLVSSTAEFTAGMKNSKYHFYSRKSCFVVDSDRNTSSVIHNGNGIILINCYNNLITITGQGFIYGIIYNLIHQMMQSSAGSSTNVHTRSFSNCFETFQNLYLVSSIIILFHDLPPLFRFLP